VTSDAEVWEELHHTAKMASFNAYAPYSQFYVGAAGITDARPYIDIITGVNIENASYGLTMCAENSLVAKYVNEGKDKITKFVACDPYGRILMPCGKCRQLLLEHFGPNLQVLAPNWEVLTLNELLPMAFSLKE
jgi:cytidine deaminase